MEERTGSGAGTRLRLHAGWMRRTRTGMVVRGANGAGARLRWRSMDGVRAARGLRGELEGERSAR
eukprot:5593584-Prymnesium_polylepis.1